MREKAKIDALAYGAKWAVKHYDLNQDDEYNVNSIIDITAESLKLAVSIKDAAVERLQKTARLYNLDRVVVFPCIINEKIQLCYRMIGDNIPAFCTYTGILLLTGTENYLNPSYISQMEQQYGVVPFEQK